MNTNLAKRVLIKSSLLEYSFKLRSGTFEKADKPGLLWTLDQIESETLEKRGHVPDRLRGLVKEKDDLMNKISASKLDETFDLRAAGERLTELDQMLGIRKAFLKPNFDRY